MLQQLDQRTESAAERQLYNCLCNKNLCGFARAVRENTL